MKAYAVIGKFDYEGEDIQGIWTTQEEANAWLYEYIKERTEDGLTCNHDELCLYEVEGTSFTKLREFDRNLKQVYRKQ